MQYSPMFRAVVKILASNVQADIGFSAAKIVSRKLAQVPADL